MEILAEHFFSFPEIKTLSQEDVLYKSHYQLSQCVMQLVEKHLATSGIVSFLGEQSTPLLNCGLYGNGMMVACQLYLNHSYHQTGLKIK